MTVRQVAIFRVLAVSLAVMAHVAPTAAQQGPASSDNLRLAPSVNYINPARISVTIPGMAASRESPRLPGSAIDADALFLPQTSGRHWRRGFLWGFAIGGIVGGVAAYSFSPIVCDLAEDDSCRAVSVMLGVGLYGTGGGLLGMLIGGMVRKQAQTGFSVAGAEFGMSPRVGPRAPGLPWELGLHMNLPKP